MDDDDDNLFQALRAFKKARISGQKNHSKPTKTDATAILTDSATDTAILTDSAILADVSSQGQPTSSGKRSRTKLSNEDKSDGGEENSNSVNSDEKSNSVNSANSANSANNSADNSVNNEEKSSSGSAVPSGQDGVSFEGSPGSAFYTAEEPSSSEFIQLPKFEDAMKNADLRFKREHEKLIAEERRRVLEKAEEEAKRTEAQNAARPAGQVYALPEITWHVPMTSFDYLKEEEEKKARIKEREKAKRQKEGQSSHTTWKSETFMKLRQQFD